MVLAYSINVENKTHNLIDFPYVSFNKNHKEISDMIHSECAASSHLMFSWAELIVIYDSSFLHHGLPESIKKREEIVKGNVVILKENKFRMSSGDYVDLNEFEIRLIHNNIRLSGEGVPCLFDANKK